MQAASLSNLDSRFFFLYIPLQTRGKSPLDYLKYKEKRSPEPIPLETDGYLTPWLRKEQ